MPSVGKRRYWIPEEPVNRQGPYVPTAIRSLAFLMRGYQRRSAFGRQVTNAITEHCKTWVQSKCKAFYCLLEASVFSSWYLLNACWMMVVALCFQRISFALASHAAAMYSVTCSSWSIQDVLTIDNFLHQIEWQIIVMIGCLKPNSWVLSS